MQLTLQPESPREIDVDGRVDAKHNVIFIGKACQMFDGTWRCLASVGGCLCLVEVSVTLR
jgi:hypothetical protein